MKKNKAMQEDSVKVSKQLVTPNYKESLSEALNKLNSLRRNKTGLVISMAKIPSELVVGLSSPDNPFKQGLWDVIKNCFSEIIEFGLQYTEDLVIFVSNFFQYGN